jgi:hypothetical protein
MAEIVVRRASAWGDKLRAYRIIVNGEDRGSVSENGETRIAVAPGRNVVRMKIDWCWSAAVDLDVDEGTVRALECGPNAHPFLVLFYISFLKHDYLWLRASRMHASAISLAAD